MAPYSETTQETSSPRRPREDNSEKTEYISKLQPSKGAEQEIKPKTRSSEPLPPSPEPKTQEQPVISEPAPKVQEQPVISRPAPKVQDQPAISEPVPKDQEIKIQEKPILSTTKTESAPSRSSSEKSSKSRLRISIGKDAGVTADQVRQAVLGETGVPEGTLGKVELQAKHTTIEIAAEKANAVMSKMKRANIAGKRVKAKLV